MSAIFRSVSGYPRHKSGSVVLRRHASCLTLLSTPDHMCVSLDPVARHHSQHALKIRQSQLQFRELHSSQQALHVSRNFRNQHGSGFAAANRQFSTRSAPPSGGFMDSDDNDDLDDDDTWEVDAREFGSDPEAEEYRRMLKEKAEMKKHFESKKGRGWSDPLDMEEFYQMGIQYEDLPDWTPEYVSAVARERVKVHPDKIPTLAQLARLPLPLRVHPCPGDGVGKAYSLHRKRVLEQQVAVAVRELAGNRVAQIQALSSWDEKQKAVDELFEQLEEELKEKQDILSHHPKFGMWVEKALEEFLAEVDEKSKNTLYQQVARAVRASAGPQIGRLEELPSPFQKAEAAKQLFGSIGVEISPGSNLELHPLFSQWLIRAMEEVLVEIQSKAENEIYPQVADMVRSRTASLDLLNGYQSEEDVTQLAASIRESETRTFPAKQYNFAKWLLETHQEFLYQQIADIIQRDKAVTEGMREVEDEEMLRRLVNYRVMVLKQKLEKEENPLAKHGNFVEWARQALVQCLTGAGQSSTLENNINNLLMEGDISAPLSLVKRALDEQIQELKRAEYGEPYPTKEEDEKAVPIFMDCFGPGCGDEKGRNVPDILRPLKFVNDRVSSQGRMLEEWEIAAHKETKRIMLRESTRKIAQLLERSEKSPCRVLVRGKQGVGKTAALAAIVASARKSGHIVWYMPNTRYLHEHFYYTVPCKKREGIFDLPILCQHECQIILDTHKDDLNDMMVSHDMMQKFFSEKRMELVGESQSLVEILELGAEKESAAAACFSCTIEYLMTQEEKPFTMIIDEFNLLFMPAKAYHEEYDFYVNNPIPNDHLNLFKPILDAAGVNTKDDGETLVQTPVLMKKGAIVVATSESRAVSHKVTRELMENARRSTSEPTNPLVIVDVPRFSKIEVEHALANYECIGMGNFRFDDAKSITNPQEVEWLRMVASNNPQKLMNASIFP